MILSSVLFIEYLTLQVVRSYNPNTRGAVNCACFVLFKSKRTCTYLVTKKFLFSLGAVKLELLMMSDVEIIVMITMCNLMDQFPNFNSDIRHT